jgi:hypothetical protein
MSKGKYSTLMSHDDLKIPCESHFTSPLAFTITFVLITAVL